MSHAFLGILMVVMVMSIMGAVIMMKCDCKNVNTKLIMLVMTEPAWNKWITALCNLIRPTLVAGKSIAYFLSNDDDVDGSDVDYAVRRHVHDLARLWSWCWCDDGDIYDSDEFGVGRRCVPGLECFLLCCKTCNRAIVSLGLCIGFKRKILHLHSVDLWIYYVDGCNLTLIILGKTWFY